MDALSLLKQDHDEVKKILGKLEDTTERAVKTRTELFETFRTEMQAHEAIEEEIFYPALKQHAETKDITLEGYEEHHVVDLVMDELEGVPVEDETWVAKFTVMKENIEHHIEEEEGEMFPKAREVIGDELEALGERMTARKEELLSASSSELNGAIDEAAERPGVVCPGPFRVPNRRASSRYQAGPLPLRSPCLRRGWHGGGHGRRRRRCRRPWRSRRLRGRDRWPWLRRSRSRPLVSGTADPCPRSVLLARGSRPERPAEFLDLVPRFPLDERAHRPTAVRVSRAVRRRRGTWRMKGRTSVCCQHSVGGVVDREPGVAAGNGADPTLREHLVAPARVCRSLAPQCDLTVDGDVPHRGTSSRSDARVIPGGDLRKPRPSRTIGGRQRVETTNQIDVSPSTVMLHASASCESR